MVESHKGHLDRSALGAEGRVALQPIEKMSQHRFRSLRQLQAREVGDRKLLDAQLELAKVKYEKDKLMKELFSWCAWWWNKWQHWCSGQDDKHVPDTERATRRCFWTS